MSGPLPEELQGARLRLLWSRPYLGAAVWSLVPVESPGLGTLGVDKWGRLYYDPAALKSWTPEQREGVLYHEVNHILRDHAGRLDPLTDSPVLANLAGDAEINDDVRDEKVPLPDGCVYPESFGLEPHKTAEEYLAALKSKLPKRPKTGSGKGLKGKGTPDGSGVPGDGTDGKDPRCGSGATGKTAPWEAGPPGSAGPDGKKAPDGMGPAEQGIVRKSVAEAVRAEASKSRGTVPAELVRWAEEYLKPKVDWRRELRGAVRASIGRAAGMEDYSFHKPHRRSAALGVVLPSLNRPIPRVAVVVDTSGSMGGDELSRAKAEVDGVLRTVGTPIEVLSVDAAVHSRKRVAHRSHVKLTGGGGTDMGVGVAAIAETKPRPNVGIIITDGYTPWPEVAPAGIRWVVCLVSDGQSPGWARTVRVPAAGA